MSEQMYDGRYLVIGPPGTGKTTFLAKQVVTIVERFERQMLVNWETPVLVCSLTKAAAAEVAGRDMPVERGAVGTLHSHCYHQLGRPRIVNRDDVKVWNIDAHWPLVPEKFPAPKKTEEALEQPTSQGEDSRVLTEQMRHGQDVFEDMEVYRHRKVPRADWTTDASDLCDDWEAFKEERGCVDFTDLITRSLIQTNHAPGKPWVILVDESQDLSTIEYELVKKWGERSAATILVGDPLQTIYGWRGSDPSVLDDPDIPESHRRVLSQSYRVPKRVLEASVHWVRTYLGVEPAEYKPRADPFDPDVPYDGWVRVSESRYENPRQFVGEVMDMLKEKPDETVMIQATCAYMLNGTIGELRYRGVPYANPWKATRGDWNPLRGENSTASRLADAMTTCSDSPKTEPWTYVTVGRLMTVLKARGVVALKGGQKRLIADCKRYEAHQESTPTEVEVEEWFGEDGFLYRAWLGEKTEREFMDWWYDRRKSGVSESNAQYLRGIVYRSGSDGLRRKPQVYVGTCHSFKGSEAGVVYVFPDLSPKAHVTWAKVGTEERDEIVRQFYVAMTRSQEGLVICRNSSIQCAPLRREIDGYIHASA